jgi:hypothetical protein
MLHGAEDVEAGLKPLRKSMRDFQGLVQLMIGGKRAVRRRL